MIPSPARQHNPSNPKTPVTPSADGWRQEGLGACWLVRLTSLNCQTPGSVREPVSKTRQSAIEGDPGEWPPHACPHAHTQNTFGRISIFLPPGWYLLSWAHATLPHCTQPMPPEALTSLNLGSPRTPPFLWHSSLDDLVLINKHKDQGYGRENKGAALNCWKDVSTRG